MGRPRGAPGQGAQPGARPLGGVLRLSASSRRMDTFLLAWGFLGLCLPGSGGAAETGKRPPGVGGAARLARFGRAACGASPVRTARGRLAAFARRGGARG